MVVFVTCAGCQQRLQKTSANFSNTQMDKKASEPKYCKTCATARDGRTAAKAAGGTMSSPRPHTTRLRWLGRPDSSS